MADEGPAAAPGEPPPGALPPERGHLVLVGPPGAGKTTVGEQLATRLRVPFVDLDHEIERQEGETVAHIFAERGEAYFRACERRVTVELRARPAMVIAAGGGWAADPENRALFRPGGHIIYLRVSPTTAVKRMGANVARRPLLAGGDPVAAVASLLERRATAYEAADLWVDTEHRSRAEVVDEICVRIGVDG